MAKVSVIYYSATGNTYRIAQAVETGARQAGAETRLRRIPELAPRSDIDANPAWKANVEAMTGVAVATHEDLTWADGYLFGSPTRYGVMAAPLKQFFDTSGALWAKGLLADKAVAAFTGAGNPHGGQETTLLTIYQVMYHWGAILVPPGYTDPRVYAAGGNPYGFSGTAPGGHERAAEIPAAAGYLGARLARFAETLARRGAG